MNRLNVNKMASEKHIYDRARSALQSIPVGGHDERIRIAFALKNGFGEDGRGLWDWWRGERGNDEADAVWRSIDPNGGISIGTLFHEAKKNGWCERKTSNQYIESKTTGLSRCHRLNLTASICWRKSVRLPQRPPHRY
jgi:hypothetical protein